MSKENDVYHADTSRISKSGLDLIHRSPAHYYARYLDPEKKEGEDKAALIIGSATHMIIFEPQDFFKYYVIMDDRAKCDEIGGKMPRSTTKYKEWLSDFYAENKDKQIITLDVFRAALAMKDAVYEFPPAAVLLEDGIAEERIDWTWTGYDDDGELITVQCKTKMDWHTPTGFIVDLKTTEDARPEGFGKSVFKYRYHVQAAFYSDAYFFKYGVRPKGFLFIAVEKNAPHGVTVQYLTNEQIDLGRKIYEADIIIYHKAITTGHFPCYSEQITAIQLPAWAYNSQ